MATEDRAGGLWSECCRVPAAGKTTHLVTTELVRRHRVVKGPVGGKDVLKHGPCAVGKWSTCQGNVLVSPGREDRQLKVCARWLCSCDSSHKRKGWETQDRQGENIARGRAVHY